MASIAGIRGNPVDLLETLAYNTTKGGLVNFTRALAAELRRVSAPPEQFTRLGLPS